MKIINPYTATMAAALLLGGVPALASADEMAAAPVQLNSVQSNQIYTPDNTSDPGLATIAFTNTGSMPATDVVFAVKSNNNVVDVYDAAGSFAPGVAVSKEFAATLPASDRDVVVESVTYADGSVWLSPVPDLAMSTASSTAAASSAAPADNSAMPSETPVGPSSEAPAVPNEGSAMPSDSSATPPSPAAPGETAPGSSAPNPQY